MEAPSEHPREHPGAGQPRAALSPQVAAALEALVEAARRLDQAGFSAGISADYSDSLGRNRQQILASFRDDHNDFQSADITVQDANSQRQEGSVIVRFEFTWRGVPRAGPERRFKGRAEWIFKEEAGVLRLSRTSGESFFGIRELGR